MQERARTKSHIYILALPKMLCESQTGQRRCQIQISRNEIYERNDEMQLAELEKKNKLIELKTTRKIRNKRPRGSNKLAESKERGRLKY